MSVIKRSDALSLSKCRNNQKFDHSNIEKPKIWALFFWKSFVFRLWHIAMLFGAFILFCFAFFCDSCAPPAAACCSCKLDISGFRKSFVIHAHRAPRLPSCKRLRKQTMSKAQSRMAICHSRATTDREASNVQSAEQNGDMPPAGQQQTAKQTTSNAQTKMAFRHCRTTRDRDASNVQGAEPNGDMPLPNNKSREANNIQCANQNGDTPLPSNNSSQEQQHPMRRVEWRYAPAGQQQTELTPKFRTV